MNRCFTEAKGLLCQPSVRSRSSPASETWCADHCRGSPAQATFRYRMSLRHHLSARRTLRLVVCVGLLAALYGCGGSTLIISNTSGVLALSSTAVSFGDVEIDTYVTQNITLTVTGKGSLTLNAAVTGTGFSISGVDFPVTLSAGRSLTLTAAFNPATAGQANGQLTVTANSSDGTSVIVSLSGVGSMPIVELIWSEPSIPTGSIAGYNVYRSPAGMASYILMNSSPVTELAYEDSSVQPRQAWDYLVKSIDSTGVESTPSNTVSISIP
jgi:hypothetical protein